MNIFIKVSLLIILISLTACGQKKKTLDYGVLTKADIIALKGSPLREDKDTLIYPKDEVHQFQNDKLVASLYEPEEETQNLVYWHHRFKECETTLKVLTTKEEGHLPPEYSYSCPAMGETVIYAKNSDKILRVIEHEQK